MSGITRKVTVTYEAEDGRVLVCKYQYETTFGNYSGLPENCFPDETEVGDAEYFLNGEFIRDADIPEDLQFIAEEMYKVDAENDPRFDYQEKDYDDY